MGEKLYHNSQRLLRVTVKFQTGAGTRYCTGSALLPKVCTYDQGNALFARALARAENQLSEEESWSVNGGALVECSHREFEP